MVKTSALWSLLIFDIVIYCTNGVGLAGKWSSWGNDALNSQTSSDVDASILSSYNFGSNLLSSDICIYNGSSDNTGFYGYITVDDSYNAYFGEFNSGSVASINLLDCSERWRVNIADALGLNDSPDSSIELISRNTLTLFTNSNNEEGVILGSSNHAFSTLATGYGLYDGCYVLALSTSDGSLMWSTNVGTGDEYTACNIQGMMVDENDHYAYGGMSSLANWQNFSDTAFNGKFWKIDIDDGGIADFYAPIPQNKIGVAIDGDGYTGSGIWGFPSIIDEYVLFGIGNLYTVPDYVIDCLDGSNNINYTTNPYNPCNEDESQYLEYKCREADVIFDSYVILNKNTFEIEAEVHINGIDAWGPTCTGLSPTTNEQFCTTPLQYQTFPVTPDVMTYPDTDVVAVSAFYDIDNNPMGVIHAKSGQFITFSIPSGEVYSAQKLGPWTTGGGGSTSIASDSSTQMAIATQTGGFFWGSDYAMIYPYDLPDGNVIYSAGVVYGVNLTSGNIIWETPNPYGQLNDAYLCDKFPFCKNYDDPTWKGICLQNPELFENDYEIITNYIGIEEEDDDGNINHLPLNVSTRAQFKGPTAIANDLAFIPSITGDVFVLDLYNGEHLKTLSCPNRYYSHLDLWNRAAIQSGVTVIEDRVLFFCGSGGSTNDPISNPGGGNQLISIQFYKTDTTTTEDSTDDAFTLKGFCFIPLFLSFLFVC